MVREVFCLRCDEGNTTVCNQCINNMSIVIDRHVAKTFYNLSDRELKGIEECSVKNTRTWLTEKVERYNNYMNEWTWGTADIEDYILNNYDENHKKSILVKKIRESRESNYLKLIAAREELKELINKSFSDKISPTLLNTCLSLIYPHEMFNDTLDADTKGYDSHSLAIMTYLRIVNELNEINEDLNGKSDNNCIDQPK